MVSPTNTQRTKTKCSKRNQQTIVTSKARSTKRMLKSSLEGSKSIRSSLHVDWRRFFMVASAASMMCWWYKCVKTKASKTDQHLTHTHTNMKRQCAIDDFGSNRACLKNCELKVLRWYIIYVHHLGSSWCMHIWAWNMIECEGKKPWLAWHQTKQP